MPLLTPLRLGGSSDPVLKEANYFQYLPHSREARSSRGQACETFLQQLPSLPSPALSSFLPLYLHSLSLLASFCIALIFCICLLFFALSNILSVIYFYFLGKTQAATQPFVSNFCAARGGWLGLVLLAYFKVVTAAMLTAVRLSFYSSSCILRMMIAVWWYCRYAKVQLSAAKSFVSQCKCEPTKQNYVSVFIPAATIISNHLIAKVLAKWSHFTNVIESKKIEVVSERFHF